MPASSATVVRPVRCMPSVAILEEFRLAVADFTVEDLDLSWEPEALAAARRSLAETGLLLVGEVHGVRQNPLLIRALMGTLGVTSLALEWPAELTDMLQTFLREGRLIHHEWLWGGDGRITAGHFAVLQERARAGSLAVTLFDSMTEPSWSWSDRDEAMGRRLLGSPARDASTLVVAGNAHTHLTPTDLGPPLGARLAQERPGVREIRINYGNGGFYNFQPRRFGPHIAGHQPRVAVEDAYSSSICPRPTRRSCRSVRASSGRGGLSPRALAPPPPRPGRPGDRRRCPARRPWC